MKLNGIKYEIVRFVRAFYPIQLLFAHVKYNLFSLFFWFLLFSIASDGLGSSFGLPFLFYSPEYQGETSMLSFLLIGLSVGGFTMAFHTYSYAKLCKKFPFLLTISHSFIKFSLNNSIIPIVFISYFIYKFSVFQLNEELADKWLVLKYITAFLTGFFVFIFLAFLYFFPRNRDSYRKIKSEFPEEEGKVGTFLNKKVDWVDYFKYKKHRTYIYLVTLTKWRLSKRTELFDKKVMETVFRKIKISSTLFEFTTIIAFLLVGIFRESPILELPAGMSIIMLLAIIMMIYSSLYSWLNYWTFPTLLFVALIMNYFSKNTSIFQYRNYAYGMSYQEDKLKKYDYRTIDSLNADMVYNNRSKREYIKILNRWKYRTNRTKPKLVIVLTSGGGSRSALWTFSVLQFLDSRLKRKVSRHTQLITGASGGMIGAAYYRALYLNQFLGEISTTNLDVYDDNIAKDLLNKLSFSAYSNDLLFRLQKIEINGHKYTKDRGYSFEEHLNENTMGILNKDLAFYRKFERFGKIPVMVFTPTIVNDGRRCLISSQNLNFLCSGRGSASVVNNMNENIDFQTFFHGNTSVRFLSVLRMSATFPLVLPMVSMPTKPEINIMDAGIRDNYGVKLSFEYLFALQKWIEENTSGVILLKIRDTKKVLDDENIYKVSLFEKFTLPFGNMYKNFTRTQDFDQDELMKIAAFSFKFPINLVEFNLRENSKDRISLSWHLTAQEKLKIKNAFSSKGNQLAFEQLKLLLR